MRYPKLAKLLLDDMGTGKTVQALAASWMARASCMLVVAPPTPCGVWVELAEQWSGLKAIRLDKTEDLRWPNPGECAVVSYNKIGMMTRTIRGKRRRIPKTKRNGDKLSAEERAERERKRDKNWQGWVDAYNRLMRTAPHPHTALVLDEAHWVKSDRSNYHHGCKTLRIAVQARGGAAWALTGTPIPRDPLDFWGLLEVMGLESEWAGKGGPFQQFIEHFDGRQIKWLSPAEERSRLASSFGLRWEKGDESSTTKPLEYVRAIRILEQKLARRKRGVGGSTWKWADNPPGGPIYPRMPRTTLRRESSVALPGLPKRQYVIRKVPTARTYRDDAGNNISREIKRAARLIGQRIGKRVDAIKPSEVAAILTELDEHEHLSTCLQALARAKIPAMQAMIAEYEEAGVPLVVASAYRAPVDALMGRKGWGVVSGGVSSKDRDKHIADFTAGRLHGLAITQSTGGEGLTLIKCGDKVVHQMLVVSRTWSAALEEQIERRCARYGQTKSVTVTDLLTEHPLEWAVLRALARKQSVSRTALKT